MYAIRSYYVRELREGGDVAAVERAFAALCAAAEATGRDLRIGAEFVLMRENLHELPATLAWAAERGANFALVTHMLPYDAQRAAQAAAYNFV